MYFPFSFTPEYDANLTTPTLLIKLKEIIIYYANGIGVISVEVVNKYPKATSQSVILTLKFLVKFNA